MGTPRTSIRDSGERSALRRWVDPWLSWGLRALRSWLGYLDPAPWVLAALVFVILVAWGALAAYDRFARPAEIVIAAGGRDGESFQIISAMGKLIEARHPNVRVRVRATRGTEENLRLLRAGDADLAAAQADVALEAWLRPTPNTEPMDGGVVAVLYEDTVQMLSCAPSPVLPKSQVSTPTAKPGPGLESAAGPRREAPAGHKTRARYTARAALARIVEGWSRAKVYLPYEVAGPSGGQYRTFLRIAKHYGLTEHDSFEFVDDRGRSIPPCDEAEAGNLIFRVRAQGNRGVKQAVNEGWRLVEFLHAGSLPLENRALYRDVIASGTYRAQQPDSPSAPEPDRQVQTLGVRRLLLARCDDSVAGWLVRELAEVLNEAGPALARRAEPAAAGERLDRILLNMPALNSIEQLTTLGVPLHPEAAVYYDPRLSWFSKLNDNADGMALLITAAGVFLSAFLATNRFSVWLRKHYADELMTDTTRLMTALYPPENGVAPDRMLPHITDVAETVLARFGQGTAVPEEIRHSVFCLADGQVRMTELDALFTEAGRALAHEEISEESFRTFNEAYKAAREAIENAIETQRRHISLYYVKKLMRFGTDPATTSGPAPAAGVTLDDLLVDAERVLTDPLVFSRESFRTFTDAYTLARSRL